MSMFPDVSDTALVRLHGSYARDWTIEFDTVNDGIVVRGEVLGQKEVLHLHTPLDQRSFEALVIESIERLIDERYAQVGPEYRQAKQLATTAAIPPYGA